MTTEKIRYSAPPIVERVVGLQMQPIAGWTTAHVGLFLRDVLGDEWEKLSEQPRVQDKFERFGIARERHSPGEFTLDLGGSGSRIWIETALGNRLLQLQNTRMHLNWRKRDDKEYPPYSELVAEFQEHYERYESFLVRQGLEKPVLNQWELTYIDHVPVGEAWSTPSDWGAISPILSDPLESVEGLSYDGASLAWAFTLPDKVGRLSISARYGVNKDGTEVVILDFTARGPLVESSNYKRLLDIGHDAAIQAFGRLTSEGVQQMWGRQ